MRRNVLGAGGTGVRHDTAVRGPPTLAFSLLTTWALEFVPASALIGFAYVTVCSQWLRFFAWCRALALDGVAWISQLKLLMPFVTIIFAALLLGEPSRGETILTALAVSVTLTVGRHAAITQWTGTRLP